VIQRNARRGFTLAEAVVSTAVVGMLALGMAGALVVVARAAPATDVRATTRTRLNTGLDQLCAELRYLTGVSSRGTNHIEFTVADRDSNGVDEVIRYDWAGAGSPLRRSYNGGAAVDVVPDVRAFDLSFATTMSTVTTTTTGSSSSGEVLLSRWNGWLLVLTPNQLQSALTSTAWATSYFRVDQVTLPANVSRLEFTRVRVRARRVTTPTGTEITAGIYSTGSGVLPSTTQIGSSGSIPVSSLTTSYAWVDFPMTGVVTDGKTQQFNLVLKGTNTAAGQVQYYNSTLASSDTPVYLTTTNSGGSWAPTSNQHQNDLPHEIYGTYSWPVNVTTSVDTHKLKSVTLRVEAGTPAARVEATVRTLNQPTVMGP
jgi:hypothetical protein